MATVEELMANAVDARRAAKNAIALAVREARAANWSWDKISAALGGTPNGETLRRNFGDEKDIPRSTTDTGSASPSSTAARSRSPPSCSTSPGGTPVAISEIAKAKRRRDRGRQK